MSYRDDNAALRAEIDVLRREVAAYKDAASKAEAVVLGSFGLDQATVHRLRDGERICCSDDT